MSTAPATAPIPIVADELVEAAGRLLEEAGIAGFSTREVARRAGVLHDGAGVSFPRQSTLLAAVAHRAFRELRRTMSALHEGETDGRAAVQAVAELYVTFAWKRPALFEVIFRHDLLAGSGQELRQSSLPVLEDFTALVRRAVPEASAETATDLWASIHGIAVLRSRGVLGLVGVEDPVAMIRRVIGAHLPRG